MKTDKNKQLSVSTTQDLEPITINHSIPVNTDQNSLKARPEMKDVMLIGAARRVEHYEIAAYTGACDLARVLNLPEILKRLSSTLIEEVATDDILAKAGVTALATAYSSEE